MSAPRFNGAAPPSRPDARAHPAQTPAAHGRTEPDRYDPLYAMHHELRPGGLPRLVHLLGRLVDGEVALLDETGRILAATAAEDLLSQVGDQVALVASRRVRSAATDVGALTAEIFSIGESAPYAVLVVVREQPFTAAARLLVADAGRLLWLRWRVDALTADERRLDQAGLAVRHAVLQMLMSGEVSAARRTAGAMTPPLPDTVRVYIMECATDRDRVAAQCADAAEGRAWIVPCPVYSGHLIVLAQAAEAQSDRVQQVLRTLASARTDLRVGISHGVGLPETSIGYQQAMHALAAARSAPQRAALFTANAELAEVLGGEAPPWAARRLQPLLQYVPGRQGDPDAEELLTTLDLWLDFGPGSAALLKLHRNSLGGRLRRIEQLLGRNLAPIGTQAELGLALRLLRLRLARQAVSPADAATGADLDALLASPEAARWADLQLAPLMNAAQAPLLHTVRTWLEHNTVIEPTATALGISVPGVRKRLARVEQLLQRSLLTGPSAVGDLWLALRSQALHRAEPA